MTGLPRSLLIVDFEEGKSTSRRYLVVGQATGRVVAIPFVDKALDLTDKRIITLGDSPVLLTKCCVEGRPDCSGHWIKIYTAIMEEGWDFLFAATAQGLLFSFSDK